MNLKIPLRLGRILVVLALIVALLGSSIPMPARAAGFVPGLYDIAANIGVNAALRAIGVGPGNSPDAFNQLVTDAANNLFEGLSPLTQVFLDYTANGFRAFLSADFLARLLSFLFDSGMVTASGFETVPPYKLGEMSYSDALSLAKRYQNYVVVHQAGGSDALYLCTGSLSVGTSYPVSLFTSDGVIYQFSGRSTSADLGRWDTGNNYANIYIARDKIEVLSGSPGYSSSSDLTVDSVSDSLSGSAYADWTAGSITQEDQSFVPVSIPSISDSTAIFTQTQAQAQAGTIPETVVDEIVSGAEVVPETGTIADVITAVRALGVDIVAAVQSIPAAIADIFSPAADPQVYQVDLKDFFPFCIPFDLFDIVTVFAAEPEAPVFEWPISVPRWGFEYTLKVDLQEWEDIASLFRTLELTIFCVGLAIVTREKFLRS